MKCVGVVASADGAKAKVVIGHKEGCTGCGMNALAGGKCPCER